MLFYEILVEYERQTGEDNPGRVKETYLVEGLTPADVQMRLHQEIAPFIFGDYEYPSCKRVQFFDVFPSGKSYWYKAKVEMITVDGNKETRKAVNILLEADTVHDAVAVLDDKLQSYDCEVISIAKTPIMDILRGVN